MMEIQRKGEQWRQVIGVGSGHVDGMFGWIKKHDDRTVFYPSTHWEPVEEWVEIQVRKSQWDCVNKCCNMLEVQRESDTYPDTCTLSWRYPQ